MHRRIGSIALLILGVLPTHAKADPVTVASTYPAAPVGYAVEGSLAFKFTSPVDGRLHSLTAFLGRDDLLAPPGNEVALSIFSDLDGRPGSALETLSVKGLYDWDAGGPDEDAFDKMAFSTTHPELQAGRSYWFVGTGIDGTFAWGAGFGGDVSWPIAYKTGTSDWMTDSSFPGAFIVTAVSTDSAPVPEPATLTLIGIGLAATGWRVRRRRAQPDAADTACCASQGDKRHDADISMSLVARLANGDAVR
jgi:hypothetical protein